MPSFSWVGPDFTFSGTYTKTTESGKTPEGVYNEWTATGGFVSAGHAFSSKDDGYAHCQNGQLPPALFSSWSNDYVISSEGAQGFFKNPPSAPSTSTASPFLHKSRMYLTNPWPSIAFLFCHNQDSGIFSDAAVYNGQYFCTKAQYGFYNSSTTQPTYMSMRVGPETIDYVVKNSSSGPLNLEVVTTDGTTRTNSYVIETVPADNYTYRYSFVGNSPPLQPSNLAASTPVKHGDPVTASWTHNDAESSPQTNYQLRWRKI